MTCANNSRQHNDTTTEKKLQPFSCGFDIFCSAFFLGVSDGLILPYRRRRACRHGGHTLCPHMFILRRSVRRRDTLLHFFTAKSAAYRRRLTSCFIRSYRSRRVRFRRLDCRSLDRRERFADRALADRSPADCSPADCSPVVRNPVGCSPAGFAATRCSDRG